MSSIPNSIIAGIGMIAGLAGIYISSVWMMGLALTALAVLAGFPRGALFPAGVFHDAFYRGTINIDIGHECLFNRQCADAIYREIIISMKRESWKLPFTVFAAYSYWIALRVCGAASWNPEGTSS